MRSMPVAMAWEFWQSSRFNLLVGLACAIAAPGLLYSMFGTLVGRHEIELGGPTALYIDFIFLIMAGSVLATMVLGGHSFPSRLYARPVATWMLVLCQMLQSMAAVSLLYVIAAALVNALFHVGWPVWGPTLFFAVTVACLQAAIWPKAGLPQVCAATLVATAAFFWLKWRFGGPGFVQPSQSWTSVTAGELLTLASAAAAAYGIAVLGVGRHRCGEQKLWPAVERWFERVTAGTAVRREPFTSPAAAQAWSLWQEAGQFVNVLFLVLFGVPLAICLFLGISGWSTDAADLLRNIGVVALIGLPAAGYIFGFATNAWNLASPQWSLRPFIATRPVRSEEMSASILRAGAVTILSVAALGSLGMLLAVAVFAATGHLEDVVRFYRSLIDAAGFPMTSAGPWFVVQFAAGIALASWSIMGLCASLVLAGHPKQLSSFIGGGMFLGSLVVYVINFQVPAGLVPACAAAAFAVVGLFCAGGIWTAYVLARRRGLISARLAWSAPVAWLVMCAVAYTIGSPAGALQEMYALLVCGLLALPFAPLATTPLAVAWNRHL